MFKNIRFYAVILLYLGLAYSADAQEETSCDPTANLPVAQGEVLFNYGSVTNSFSFTNRSDMTVGQPLVGRAIGRENISEYGFWTRFLLPPQPPTLQATQGDFPDRVQLMWNIDPLSAAATGGYIIKRDDAFLADVDGETNQFIDFNVQAGEFYQYSVIGRNQFGTGSAGTDVGFVNPNGVVTGKIETFSGNPVADAIVTLEPTIGKSMAFDGVKDYLCVSHQASVPTDMWTLSTWVKIGDNSDNAGIIDFGSDINKNYWLKTTASGSPKGIVAGVGDDTAPHELTVEFTEDPDDWHHVAVVYSAGMLIVYVDGVYEGSMRAAIVNEDALFNIGANRSQTNFFHGKLDDIRLYDKPLTQTDIILTKDITVSSITPNLVAYWKLDEGLGRKAFDIAGNDMDAFIQGATFDSDTPDILNAGMTDVGGYYIIEGVNYSEEQTFQARPRKSFYNHYSIEYNAAFEACTNLTSFDLSDTATVEITVQPFDLVSRQTILSQSTNFELYIENSAFHLMINGTDQELGPASAEFQHLALLLNGMNGQVQYYRNGSLVNTLSGYSLTGDFSSSPWQLAAKGGTMPTGFFTGLIDDVAFFDTLVSVPKLQIHASPIAGEGVESGVDAGDGNLIAYFPLDAGSGTEVVDYGPLMTGTGEVKNASFSIIAYRQVESPHEFRPSERVVNLNPSVTAVGNIDFVDESTVTISGVVRFSETFCYQDSVQLYVNGFPSFPPIFTDQDGRFVGDFEPGSNITLTPVFADTTHKFTPPFFETRKLNRPIAGVLFQNTTKRDIYGQIAGGDCRLSINFPEAPVRVKAATLNGCYEQELAITALDGKYHFEDLPPLPMAVSITYHPDNTIYQDFQVQGGQETDLRMLEDDTIDFIYIAPPQVELESFEPFAACPGGDAFIDQSTPQNGYRLYKNDVRVYEEYKNERCYLDTFNLRINNAVADAPEYRVTVSDTTTFPLEYWAGLPNLGGDYKKLLQVTAETSTGTATATEEVVVLGERSRETTFTTASPAMPLIVLRDPPGDGSNATLSAGTTNCSTWSNTQMISRTEERSLNIDLGTKVVTYAGTPFGGIIMENEDQAELDFTASATAKVSTESSMEVCVTNDIEYSTTDDDAIIGEDADLYVGAAVNFEFSTTDVLGYDFENCEFTFDQNFRVWPEGFGTKYIYSEWQIETDVIPSLLLIGDTTSAQAWQRIIDENHRAKANAVLRENVTFDGLVSITETQETSTTSASSFEFDLTVSAEMASTLGFEVFDVGTKVTVKSSIEGGVTASEATSSSETTTVSYTLADDDPNDNFTIDILDDGVYGTPVFKVRSGESMCPWEEGTLNREEVGFASDALTAVNVPENASAVFNLQMTNLGQTGNDPLIYILGLVEGSNPDGAALIVDGEPLTDPRVYQILPNETLDILLAVERGPLAYSYDSLGIFMASECMWEHSRGLGYDLANTMGGIDPETGEAVREGPYKSDDLAKFYEELRLNVEFIEPCTPIDISFPMQDWVVTPTDNDRLLITLNDYIYNDPDLDIVRVQYRRTGGDGSWINIVELPASEFANDPVFKIVEWDMTELKDGPYEIRAVSQCTDVSLNPGISTIVKGRKETQAPELFGTPQPADGILNPGDEISITFTKRIQCDRIFQADGIGTNINFNNLALVDVATGTLIDAIITCREDKIIVVPNIQNQYIENRTLRVVTNDIKDLYGNETDEIAWEFFVNRSNLYWDGGGIDEMIQEGDRLIVTKEIRNQGGAITSFDIPSIPDWMQVFPRSGSLAPGTRQTVTFEFPADLLVDTYETDIIMETVDGPEPLNVKLRVNCEGPDWSFDATQYSFSMNLTVELDIEGVISTDRVDRIAAFVGTELRGLAYVEYAEELDRHLAFLTVYSNEAVGETVDFQIWDADICTLYGNTLESFPFEPDGLIGEPLAPQTIHTSGLILKKIYINPGWNWISYNIELQDPNINEALSSLTNPSTGLIKDQTTFANYSDNLGIWGGSLTELTHLTMYQYRSSAYDSLLLVGLPVDPSTPMPIATGWNWIGYLPQQGMAVDEALSSLTPLNGDIVKGQFTFAQYVAGIGWIGNLNFMTSPKGYQLRISNPGTLVYPAAGSGNLVGSSPQAAFKNRQLEDEPVFSHWEVNPQAYEYTMNFIGLVRAGDNPNFLAEGDEVAAFVGDEVRGSSQVIYIPELDAHLIFLTVYANREGERLTFKFFDASAGEEMALQEESSFLINAIQGTVDEPVEWSFLTTDVVELNADGMHFRAFPNPAREVVYLRFDAELNEEVTIVVTDALGREVQRLETKALARENTLEWRPKVPSGLYFVTLHRATSIQTLRLEIKQ